MQRRDSVGAVENSVLEVGLLDGVVALAVIEIAVLVLVIIAIVEVSGVEGFVLMFVDFGDGVKVRLEERNELVGEVVAFAVMRALLLLFVF